MNLLHKRAKINKFKLITTGINDTADNNNNKSSALDDMVLVKAI